MLPSHLSIANLSQCKAFLLAITVALACIVQTSVADNPLVSHVYTADPTARVFNDRMYVITTHDMDGQVGYSSLVNYHLFSSSDLVNWQDHGVVFDVRKDTKWASLAFAPDFIEHNGKYYLYFPDGADSIGVAVADRPEGPYVDALGKPLVDRDTPGAKEVVWIFDPGVFIDDDGSAYLYFGGAGPGNLRVIRLGDDLISTEGKAEVIDAPHYFEAPYLNKRNGIYYLSYSTNGDNGGSITIDYLTSKHPMKGFKHQGTMLKNPWDNRGNNNHQSLVKWKGQWYVFYHNRGVAAERGAGTFERSINVDLMAFDGDKIALAKDTREGVPAIQDFNPYTTVQAETMDREYGIETQTTADGKVYVEYDAGDWVKVSNVDFGKGAKQFNAQVAAKDATAIDLYLDRVADTPVATVPVPSTGGLQKWQTVSFELENVEGKHNLFVRAKGRLNLDSYQFQKADK